MGGHGLPDWTVVSPTVAGAIVVYLAEPWSEPCVVIVNGQDAEVVCGDAYT